MSAYARIMVSKDSSDELYGKENELLSVAGPRISYAADAMLVALANSGYGARLEEEYFGEGFCEEYREPEYTEKIIALMEEEAALVSEYTSISTKNTEITYGGITASFEETVERLQASYPEGSEALTSAVSACKLLFEEAISEKSSRIFVDLLKIRKRIAGEYGYSSYAEYATRSYQRDYGNEELNELIEGISEYAVPVYADLSTSLSAYMRNTEPPELTTVRLLNGGYRAIGNIDPELAEIYANMLGRGCYDVKEGGLNRTEGAFTTYLYDYEAPYLFMTAEGTVSDYLTLSHEFGHFIDFFLNGSANASLEMLEISSQGLELLTLYALKSELNSDEYKYLLYSEMYGVLMTLISQSFYATFEHLAYALPEEEITAEALDRTVIQAAEKCRLNTAYFNELSKVLVAHMITAPFYLQAYIPSLLVSLEIYFKEAEGEGDGKDTYLALLTRDGGTAMTERLDELGLNSPFEKKTVMELCDMIYYSIYGIHYYRENGGENAA